MWNLITSYVYFALVRPLYKWVLRLVTGQCELLRITYHRTRNSHKSFNIEYSLLHSKHRELRHIMTDDDVGVDDAIAQISSTKQVNLQKYPVFQLCMKTCLSQIIGYRKLLIEVESLRRTAYSSGDSRHEENLRQLWTSLRPDMPLQSRIGPHWGDIGFQGDDPATDFRGMGMLGLCNLLFLSTEHAPIAQRILSHSAHPQLGYSFAIVGINMTSLSYHLLMAGHLKTHFYNVVPGASSLRDFHLVYVYVFHEFDKFWFAENPKDIMQFNVVKDKFEQQLTERLTDRDTQLILNVMSPDNAL